jgi:hypothetical protein
MEVRRLISLVLVVTGLLVSPAVALVIGACERRAATHSKLAPKTAARTMLVAAIASVALVSVGITLTFG